MLNQRDFQNYKALKTMQQRYGNNPEILARLGFSKARLTGIENRLRRYLGNIPDEIQRDAMRNYIFGGMTPDAAARAAVHSKTPGASSRSVHSFVLFEIREMPKSRPTGSKKKEADSFRKTADPGAAG